MHSEYIFYTKAQINALDEDNTMTEIIDFGMII